jgi:N-acylglucosamine 2-epimerase
MAAAERAGSRLDWAERLEQELFERVLPFWLRNSWHAPADLVLESGFFDCLDRTGAIYDTKMHVWLQGRQVWMLARLANEATDEQLGRLKRATERLGPSPDPRVKPIQPNREGLFMAARAGMEFLLAHAVDPADGTVCFALTPEGKPCMHQRKPFGAAFLAMAIAEVARFSHDAALFAVAEGWLDRVVGWMARPELLRGSPPPGATAWDPLNYPMILLNMISEMSRFFATATERAAFRRELRAECAARIVKHWRPELGVTLENIRAEDAGLDMSEPEGRLHNPGHAIEAGWFLMEEGATTGDHELVHVGAEMAQASLLAGWDGPLPGKESASGPGGILYFLDVKGHDPTQLEWDMKLWWPLCEAMVALAIQDAVTSPGDGRPLEQFQVVASFALEHLASDSHGEWFGYLSRDLRITHSFKGGPYKGCFHVPRALWMCVDWLKRPRAIE